MDDEHIIFTENKALQRSNKNKMRSAKVKSRALNTKRNAAAGPERNVRRHMATNKYPQLFETTAARLRMDNYLN